MIDQITLDLNTVKGNSVYGFLIWNSTGTLSHSVVENNQVPDASGGYYEIGMYLRALAPERDASNRAAFSITNNTFQNVGRVGILAHDWVNVTIAHNTLLKTEADFGYGMEIGSGSIATITDNVIHGFNTPALSDNSFSGGIYIENAFTSDVITPAVIKTVTIANNELYDNQDGLVVGNEYNGLAGNVDIGVILTNNFVHNNEYGVVIADEDKSAGSSVTVTGRLTIESPTIKRDMTSPRLAMARYTST